VKYYEPNCGNFNENLVGCKAAAALFTTEIQFKKIGDGLRVSTETPSGRGFIRHLFSTLSPEAMEVML
jgi:hypothetical protein